MPMVSRSAAPTSELAGDTTPLMPVAPLAHVTAPAFERLPLCQAELRTTKFPLASGVTSPSPTESNWLPPTSEFTTDTGPFTPVFPFPHVTAPANDVEPLLHEGLRTT